MQTPEASSEGIQNFVFVTTGVAYKELSDFAFQLQQSVPQFVQRAILEQMKRDIANGRAILPDQEENQ